MSDSGEAYFNWVRMDDVEEVVRGLQNSACFQRSSVDEAVERVMREENTPVFQASGVQVKVKEDGLEYTVQPGYDEDALNEFADSVLPRSDDVQPDFAETVVAEVRNAYENQVAADGGYQLGDLSDVDHTPSRMDRNGEPYNLNPL